MKLAKYCLLMLLVFSPFAEACSCRDSGLSFEDWVKKNYRDSKHVFVATITKSEIIGKPDSFDSVRNEFSISDSLKVNPDWKYIFTEGNNGTSCATKLTAGYEYLFFLDKNHVSHCTPKLLLSPMQKEDVLDMFKEIKSKEHNKN